MQYGIMGCPDESLSENVLFKQTGIDVDEEDSYDYDDDDVHDDDDGVWLWSLGSLVNCPLASRPCLGGDRWHALIIMNMWR